MTAKELSQKTGIPLWKVYYVTNRLGRLPSADELTNWKQKRGRPIKWIEKEKEN